MNFNVNMADSGDDDAYVDPGAVISVSHANAKAAATRVPTYICPSDSFTLNDCNGICSASTRQLLWKYRLAVEHHRH